MKRFFAASALLLLGACNPQPEPVEPSNVGRWVIYNQGNLRDMVLLDTVTGKSFAAVPNTGAIIGNPMGSYTTVDGAQLVWTPITMDQR